MEIGPVDPPRGVTVRVVLPDCTEFERAMLLGFAVRLKSVTVIVVTDGVVEAA